VILALVAALGQQDRQDLMALPASLESWDPLDPSDLQDNKVVTLSRDSTVFSVIFFITIVVRPLRRLETIQTATAQCSKTRYIFQTVIMQVSLYCLTQYAL